MKSDKHNNLTADELTKLANGSAGPRAERQASADDLNYLAERGFAKAGITSADVSDVVKRIDARTFSLTSLNSVFIGGLVFVLFSLGFFFVMNENNKTIHETPAAVNSPQQNIPQQTGPVLLSEVVVDSPVQKSDDKEKQQYKKEHFASENPESFDAQVNAADGVHEDMSFKKAEDLADNNFQEIKFEQLPNAPVVYIERLKITNFQKYYFKDDKKFEIVNGGFDAEYGDAQDYLAKRRDMKSGAKKVTAVDVLREAMQNFNAGDYSGCISELDVLLKLNSGDVNAVFYTGMSYYFLGKPARAIESFDKIINHENNIFHQEAEFYKALALLQTSRKHEGVSILKKIIDEGGFYAARAKEQLKH